MITPPHRSLLVGLAVCLLSMVVITACAIPETVAPHSCQPAASETPGTVDATTRYLFTLQQIPDGMLQAGAEVTLTWLSVICPRTTTRQADSPAAVDGSLALYGPYASQYEAAHAMVSIPAYPKKPTVQPAVTSVPFGMSDWSGGGEHTRLSLPATLPSGYYFVLADALRPIDQAWCRTTMVVRVGS